jgi:putative cardiolipin synthase
VTPLLQQHPARSGIAALPDGRGAFAARALLADAAERSLDVQYYIWHRDLSGTLLFDALRRAADRGVRVRLLLDDNNTRGLDDLLAALNAHPNLEVRLFNPFMQRRWRALGYLTDFERLNRRMHNKSFIADNQVAIIGGRNVGDEYFGADEHLSFADLDVLAVGPVVDEVSKDFDRYWASGSSYPAERLLPAADAATITALAAGVTALRQEPTAIAYLEALTRQPFVRDLLAGRLDLEWATTRMVSDDPAKALGQAAADELLWSRLLQVIGKPTRELQLVSPYFVPGAEGVEAFRTLAAAGVRIEILTNSLEATDVAAVHAGYAKRRKPLLEAGVVLLETKRGAAVAGKDHGFAGSSAASLHAKTFAVDRSRVFVGSFNFDPRSARLNTEIGFVIDSAVLAQAVARAFADDIPERAYRVRLDDSGALQWVERRGGEEIVHASEPGAGFWRRLGVSTLQLLPIEWLL